MKALARWESRGGKHWVTLEDTGRDYRYESDGAAGYFTAHSKRQAIDLMRQKLTYLFPDNQKIIKRVV